MKQTSLSIAVAILTLITAVIHIYLGVPAVASGSPDIFSILFVLNGLGYIGLLVALLTPGFPIFSQQRKLAHWLLIGYAALTIVLYFYVNGFHFTALLPTISKVAELFLIIVTFLHMQAEMPRVTEIPAR